MDSLNLEAVRAYGAALDSLKAFGRVMAQKKALPQVGTMKVMIARPVGFGYTQASEGTYMFNLGIALGRDERIAESWCFEIHNARIHMARNQAVDIARQRKATHILFVDPDMSPDMYAGHKDHPEAKAFLQSSFEFLMSNPLAVIGAPALGGAPHYNSNVYVREQDGKSRRASHEYCLERHKTPAFEQVDGIGTGLMIIPTKVFDLLEKPYFDDTFLNEEKSEIRFSQDLYFTTKCTDAGIPVYCNWYAWAGHVKSEVVGNPESVLHKVGASEWRNVKLPASNGLAAKPATTEFRPRGKVEFVTPNGEPVQV